MKRFLTVLAAVALAGAIYVATAPGSQTAGPTLRQFRALKAQVTKLQRDERSVKQLALQEAFLLTDCMQHSVPIAQYGDGTGFTSTAGYSWTEPDANGGLPWLETALDVAPHDAPG